MALQSNELGEKFYREFGFEPIGTEDVTIADERYRETTYELREEALVSLAGAAVEE